MYPSLTEFDTLYMFTGNNIVAYVWLHPCPTGYENVCASPEFDDKLNKRYNSVTRVRQYTTAVAKLTLQTYMQTPLHVRVCAKMWNYGRCVYIRVGKIARVLKNALELIT